MNTPNKLTILRIIISPIFMYFFLLDTFAMRIVSLILFVIAALTDLADGYYARKYGIITGFGKFMDPLADKILVSSALISFIALKYVSPLPVILIIGREFSITGLRLLAAYSGVVIPPTWWAKVKTFIQLSFVGLVIGYVSLISGLEYYDSPVLASVLFDYQFTFNLMAWAVAAVTIGTGLDYFVKYFHMIRTTLK